MLKEIFIGRRPSHFQINSIVKAFIVSETLIWSAWNFVAPIFAIFAANEIPGGNVQVAASAFSTHLIVRVVFELFIGKYISKASEFKKFIMTIMGLSILSIAYIGFSLTKTIPYIYIFYAVVGIGLGIASPPKNALFSTHLDKDKEAAEWGIYDATVFVGVALATALGGFIANQYGFRVLFILSMIVNLLGIIPYLLYIHHEKRRFFFLTHS